jgi:LPPG:FO 2-phospho-L-lactate transferase
LSQLGTGQKQRKVLAISGGVGGAKLALGLSQVLAADELVIVANTADDFEHLGLAISPDLDTVMYTLAGINNQQLGWGLAGESWQAMEGLERLGAKTWFRLGDRDIATHLTRTELLREGASLSQATAHLCEHLGLVHRLLPMTDDPVRTRVVTAQGELAFQEYFVREQCQPALQSLYFEGVEQAAIQPELKALLQSDDLDLIVICPSNPFVSVQPLLSLAGMGELLRANSAPVVAVSPIVAGQAIKGPAAKMMQELSMPASAAAVANYYGDLLDGFIIDEADAAQAKQIAQQCPVDVGATVMCSLADRVHLAEQVLAFGRRLRAR